MRPLIRIPRRHSRAILIFLLTIVVPACVLLWLGVQSFERQREALATLRQEKLTAAIEARTVAAVEAAFADHGDPLVRHVFELEAGELVSPVLQTPLPRMVPTAFLEAERYESTQPDRALAVYGRLANDAKYAALALQRRARTLARAGRTAQARRTWRELAARFPDERDPAGRPYGIVAAIQAGDTDGLLQTIASERWALSADQAQYFVDQLGGGGAETYLDRFRLGRDLARHFQPRSGISLLEIHSEIVAGRRIFYRAESAGKVRGFEGDLARLEQIAAEVRTELGMIDPQARDLRIHIGAVALVSLMLISGIGLLARDTSREVRTSELRAQFVSGVSHDLKTPITLVRLYGETLLRHQNLSDGERRDFYRIINRESARLGRLVDQVLAFSRIERGELTFDMEEAELPDVVGRVLDDYADFLEHAGFNVTRELARDVPPVCCDSAALAQALVSLLENAVKYSGTARQIAVRVSRRPGGEAVVEVEDQGIGIPVEEQARVFDRFYRANSGSGKGGYGLGLFMVRHIMEAHAGRVEVESERGCGSRFRLVFPTVTA
jgi:signal transduction histidine kinase